MGAFIAFCFLQPCQHLVDRRCAARQRRLLPNFAPTHPGNVEMAAKLFRPWIRVGSVLTVRNRFVDAAVLPSNDLHSEYISALGTLMLSFQMVARYSYQSQEYLALLHSPFPQIYKTSFMQPTSLG